MSSIRFVPRLRHAETRLAALPVEATEPAALRASLAALLGPETVRAFQPALARHWRLASTLTWLLDTRAPDSMVRQELACFPWSDPTLAPLARQIGAWLAEQAGRREVDTHWYYRWRMAPSPDFDLFTACLDATCHTLAPDAFAGAPDTERHDARWTTLCAVCWLRAPDRRAGWSAILEAALPALWHDWQAAIRRPWTVADSPQWPYQPGGPRGGSGADWRRHLAHEVAGRWAAELRAGPGA